jgi:hypothetical protein
LCGWCNMSANREDAQAVTTGGYSAGGSLVAYPRPDEVVVPLRREEFDTLCEGGVSEAKASRDLCVGIGFGALAGLIGVLATTDWDTTWKPGHRGWFFFCLLALCVMVAGSAAGAWIHQVRLNQTINSSAFSRVRARLLSLFDEPRTLEAAIEKLPGADPRQIGARPDIKWENVANLYWLGNDLTWTSWKVNSGAPKERILHGLTQSYHHISELGLADSDPGRLLSTIRSQAESTPEPLNQQWRTDFGGKLSDVNKGVSDLAKSQQSGFTPDPK